MYHVHGCADLELCRFCPLAEMKPAKSMISHERNHWTSGHIMVAEHVATRKTEEEPGVPYAFNAFQTVALAHCVVACTHLSAQVDGSIYLVPKRGTPAPRDSADIEYVPQTRSKSWHQKQAKKQQEAALLALQATGPIYPPATKPSPAPVPSPLVNGMLPPKATPIKPIKQVATRVPSPSPGRFSPEDLVTPAGSGRTGRLSRSQTPTPLDAETVRVAINEAMERQQVEFQKLSRKLEKQLQQVENRDLELQKKKDLENAKPNSSSASDSESEEREKQKHQRKNDKAQRRSRSRSPQQAKRQQDNLEREQRRELKREKKRALKKNAKPISSSASDSESEEREKQKHQRKHDKAQRRSRSRSPQQAKRRRSPSPTAKRRRSPSPTARRRSRSRSRQGNRRRSRSRSRSHQDRRSSRRSRKEHGRSGSPTAKLELIRKTFQAQVRHANEMEMARLLG